MHFPFNQLGCCLRGVARANNSTYRFTPIHRERAKPATIARLPLPAHGRKGVNRRIYPSPPCACITSKAVSAGNRSRRQRHASRAIFTARLISRKLITLTASVDKLGVCVRARNKQILCVRKD